MSYEMINLGDNVLFRTEGTIGRVGATWLIPDYKFVNSWPPTPGQITSITPSTAPVSDQIYTYMTAYRGLTKKMEYGQTSAEVSLAGTTATSPLDSYVKLGTMGLTGTYRSTFASAANMTADSTGLTLTTSFVELTFSKGRCVRMKDPIGDVSNNGAHSFIDGVDNGYISTSNTTFLGMSLQNMVSRVQAVSNYFVVSIQRFLVVFDDFGHLYITTTVDDGTQTVYRT